jgi:hypothetical protein
MSGSDIRAAHFSRGTGSLNPSPSSGESDENLLLRASDGIVHLKPITARPIGSARRVVESHRLLSKAKPIWLSPFMIAHVSGRQVVRAGTENSPPKVGFALDLYGAFGPALPQISPMIRDVIIGEIGRQQRGRNGSECGPF